MPPEVAGGPLVDSSGKVVGILGGSLRPGERTERRKARRAFESSAVFLVTDLTSAVSAATSISELPRNLAGTTRTLAQLARDGILTPFVEDTTELLMAFLSTDLAAKDPPDASMAQEFSVRDPRITVYSEWQGSKAASKGQLLGRVYNAANRVVATTPATAAPSRDRRRRFAFSISPEVLQPGIFRIDLLWNDRPVWRTLIRITD